MGYRGKVAEQERARELRARGWTVREIEDELGVSRSSVSIWVRDVGFDEEAWRARVGERRTHGWSKRGPNGLSRRKQAEIERLVDEGRERIGTLTEKEFLVAGVALYAGEGGKSPGDVMFANSDPRMILFFVSWLRRFFDIDESRLRLRLYLHEGLDLDAANRFWSELAGIPVTQFRTPYRAVPDPSIRRTKHVFGCPGVHYACSRTHRAVMGLVEALLSSTAFPG